MEGYLQQEKENDNDNNDDDNNDQVQQSQKLYANVGDQTKSIVRQGLKIVKYLYTKFSFLGSDHFINWLNEKVYINLVEDQLEALPVRFISDRS